jgi:hypothetical protein
MNSRPVYENTATLAAESEFAAKIEKVFGCTLKKLPMRYSVDFMCVCGINLLSWSELKNRNIRSDQYPNYFLSLQKWISGNQLSCETGAQFRLFVRFTDCDMWLNCSQHSFSFITYGGRVDRDDWQDMEPMVVLPLTNFQRF